MVVVAQLVRAPDCGSGGRGFDSHHPPKKSFDIFVGVFFICKNFAVALLQKLKLP